MRWVKGHIEEIPLPDASVDVVISNCVINLSGDKPRVLREVARVLKPGGRFAVSDVIADPDMDDATRADMAAWTGCIAGALTREEFQDALTAAGLAELRFARATGCTSTPRRRSCVRASPARPDENVVVRMTRVAINGFGRVGRLALRAGWDRDDLEFVHINEPNGGPETAAHLLTFDSVHGRWDRGAQAAPTA